MNNINEEELQFLKQKLQEYTKEYLDLDEQIKALTKAIRERKNKKKEASENILKCMKQFDIGYMNIKDGKLIYSVTKNKAPMNKENITKTLSEYYNSVEKASEVCSYIFENRSKVEKVKLRRTRNKNGIDINQ